MSDNECYSTIDPVPSKVLAAKTPVPVKKNKMKCFMVAIVMATILNFLLVIGIGAALFYFQTNLTAEVRQLDQDDEFEGESGMTGIYSKVIPCYIHTSMYMCLIKGVSTRQRRGEGMQAQLLYILYRGRNAGGY